ncbi:MAG TPA: hypothetical protein VNY10_03710 [Roseiarcus sp.]|nr:hypothetical protein [Roseiarcus sp.]
MSFETLNDVLMIVVGRQRVGKTTFLNGLAQFLRGHGASFEIWDADKMNATNNMSLFHEEALQPSSGDPEDVKAWLEERFTDLVDRRLDAMLDVGGGDTPLARLIAEVPIATTLEDEGVRVVVVHVVGPDLADLDYLDRFEEDDLFSPEATLIVMNGGLVLTGRSMGHAFQQINSHKSILRTFKKGARIVRMSRLACMSEVTDRGLTFEDAMNGKVGADERNLALLDRPRVRKWWTRDFPEMIRSIPPDWLPKMVDLGSADHTSDDRESAAAE